MVILGERIGVRSTAQEAAPVDRLEAAKSSTRGGDETEYRRFTVRQPVHRDKHTHTKYSVTKAAYKYVHVT